MAIQQGGQLSRQRIGGVFVRQMQIELGKGFGHEWRAGGKTIDKLDYRKRRLSATLSG